MKLHTETKYLLELDGYELKRLFDEIVGLPSEVHLRIDAAYVSELRELKKALFAVRHGG